MYKIAVDIMGSDDAPTSEIQGIQAILTKLTDIEIIAFGTEEGIATHNFQHERLSYVTCDDVITGKDQAATAFRVKRSASMIRAIQSVKDGTADAVVSSGNTGAYITAAMFILGRIKGVKRPALASTFPTVIKGKQLIFGDMGAVADATAENLEQNGVLTTEIAKCLFNIEHPKLGLLNIGVEEKKGTEVYIEAYQLLQNNSQLNFVGNIEARYIMDGDVDALVADGFSGNIALKSYEGMQRIIMTLLKEELMKHVSTKVGGLLIKPALSELKAVFDYEAIGGAILAGVQAPVIKAHGTSSQKQFASAIRLCRTMLEKNLVKNITASIQAKKA